MEENGFEFKNVKHQYFATIAANMVMMAHGGVIGWFTPTLPILLSDETPILSGPLTNEELSWIGSVNNLGALAGIVTFCFITTIIGCKRAMMFLAFPSAAFWVLIYFGNTYYHLLFARFFAGWTGGGIQTTLVLYVAEIANDNIRGRLGSLTTLTRNIGVLFIFIIGAYVDYHIVPCIFVSLPILYLVLFVSLPNTPQFYIKKGKLQEAENALKYYKGFEGKSEIEILALNSELERLKLLSKNDKDGKSLQISDFFESKTVQGIIFGIIFAWLSQFSGGISFINYAVLVFEKSGSSLLDPFQSSILLAVAQIMAGIFSARLADSLGRKRLLIVSFLGSAAGFLVFALYLYFLDAGYDVSKSFSWIPVASLSLILFISSGGIYALFSVIIVEHLPTKTRTVGLTICVLAMYLSSFVFVKLFPILLEIIDLSGCIVIYMVGCIFGAIFVIFAQEETKGRALDTLDSKNNDSN